MLYSYRTVEVMEDPEDPKMLMRRSCLTVLATKAHKMDPSNQHYLLDSSAALARVRRLVLSSILEYSIPLTPLTPLIQRLVTLLLLNATANEALPLFLDRRDADTVTCKVLNMSRH